MLNASSLNPGDKHNSDVVKPVLNAADVVRRSRGYWTIDFGPHMPLEEAALYIKPFEHVEKHVYPERQHNNRESYREKWWIYAEARVGMREALHGLPRYIATPRVAKHRIFIWVNPETMCNDAMIVFARSDDYFFGVLHSRFHEVWALRMGTWLGKGNDPRYTPTTCFETFPFPWPPGQEPSDHPAYLAISAAAQHLHEEREAWLNPPGASERVLKDRTLTNLYNALLVFRGIPAPEGKKHPKIVAAAGDFAPRLDALHRALDRAVCDAYGWEHAVIEDEEEILRRLLALNLERAAGK